MTFMDLLPACECPPIDQDEEPGFGALSTPQGNLPLRMMDVRARVTGLLVEVELRQTWVNTLRVPVEATYIFPLPDRAAVHRFRLEVGERIVEGDLQERGQARQTYDRAIRAGHRAAIAEEERAGVFTMRVGNVMPGEEATVWLTLSGPLHWSAGEATFRFPLVVAPRYMPGHGLPGEQAGDGVALDTDAVPDASRISPPVLLPGHRNPVRLALEVELDPAGLVLGRVRSSLHAVRTSHQDGKVVVKLHPGERLDRDFILRFAVQGGSSLAVRRDAERTDQGTFLLTLVPPDLEAAPTPRDVVLVLDRSGSMEGWKMVAARRAAARMLDSLSSRDRFALLAFDDVVESPFPAGTLVQASDRNRFKAVEYLAKLNSRNGTEMAQPLTMAARMLGGAEPRERVLVLATDGQVGNEDQILRGLANSLHGVRVFTLGIDQAVNAAFLRRLADLGRGHTEVVESEDRLDEVMSHITRAIGSPVVTGLRLVPRGMEVSPDTVVPERLPDLLIGAPVLISGRFTAPAGGEPRLEVHGSDPEGRGWFQALGGRETAAAAVDGAWARGLVRQLEDRYVVARSNSEKSELEARIVATSIRHKVLCRFTAFVAVDRAEVVNEGGRLHKVTQAVEQPAGWAGKQEEAEAQKQHFYKRAQSSSRSANMSSRRCDAEAPTGRPGGAFGAGAPAAASWSAAPAGRAGSPPPPPGAAPAPMRPSSFEDDCFEGLSDPAASLPAQKSAAPLPPRAMRESMPAKDAKRKSEEARPAERLRPAPRPGMMDKLASVVRGKKKPAEPAPTGQELQEALRRLQPIATAAALQALIDLLPRLEALLESLGAGHPDLEQALKQLGVLEQHVTSRPVAATDLAEGERLRAALEQALGALAAPPAAGRKSFWK